MRIGTGGTDYEGFGATRYWGTAGTGGTGLVPLLWLVVLGPFHAPRNLEHRRPIDEPAATQHNVLPCVATCCMRGHVLGGHVLCCDQLGCYNVEYKQDRKRATR